MSDYITNNDTIIFASEFNKPLNLELINKYKNIIFSNNDNTNDIFIKSKFNQEVNNLPNSLTHLTFGYNFNQEVNNLPNSLTHLTLGGSFNQKVNNLPKVKYIREFGKLFTS